MLALQKSSCPLEISLQQIIRRLVEKFFELNFVAFREVSVAALIFSQIIKFRFRRTTFYDAAIKIFLAVFANRIADKHIVFFLACSLNRTFNG